MLKSDKELVLEQEENLEERITNDTTSLTVAELLNKKPDYSSVPVYKPTGVYYRERKKGDEDL